MTNDKKAEIINRIEGIMIKLKELSPVTEKILDYQFLDDGTLELSMNRCVADDVQYRQYVRDNKKSTLVDFPTYCKINTVSVRRILSIELSNQIKEMLKEMSKLEQK